MGKRAGRDVIDEVQSDHREIERLFGRVSAATGERRAEVFRDLVRKLAVHETAEQELVHPLTRMADARDVTERRLAEEKEAEQALSDLMDLGPEDPGFDVRFEELRVEVLHHATREEEEEHPAIRAGVARQELQALAAPFRAAEATAPTRPHPNGPTSAPGNMVVGPIVSIMDRARDAIQDAMKGMPRSEPAGSRRPRRTATTRRPAARRSGSGPVLDVGPDPKGGWRAAKRGGTRALARGDNKQEVLRRAREMAKAQRGRLVVRGADGKIQEERTYGPDPTRSRG